MLLSLAVNTSIPQQVKYKYKVDGLYAFKNGILVYNERVNIHLGDIVAVLKFIKYAATNNFPYKNF